MLEFSGITNFFIAAAEGKNAAPPTTVNAYVLYDFSDGQEYKHNLYNSRNGQADASSYFSAVFVKVQEIFNNLSVPIIIQLISVSAAHNLTVYERKNSKNDIVNRNETLTMLKGYWTAMGLQNHDVVYLFVSNRTTEEGTESEMDEAAAVTATNGTLCGSEPNAAVVRHMFVNDKFHKRPARALAYMLGAWPFRFFVSLDKTIFKEEIKTTLQRCQNPQAEEHRPAKEGVTTENIPDSGILSC
ncbi:hypothetical protein MTO96_007703 [Rhipicephalus appendiculatus]